MVLNNLCLAKALSNPAQPQRLKPVPRQPFNQPPRGPFLSLAGFGSVAKTHGSHPPERHRAEPVYKRGQVNIPAGTTYADAQPRAFAGC